MSYPDVRRALKSDVDAVTQCWSNFLTEQASLDERLRISEDAIERWENDMPLWLEDETRRVYVADRNEAVVGFATAHRMAPPPIYESRGEVYLDEIYVDPNYRRNGLGEQLVEAVMAWSDRVKAERVRLSVMAQNVAAQTFWEAQDAVSFSITYTIERDLPEDEATNEGTRKIGFV